MGDGDGAQGFRILRADATSHVGTLAFLFWPFYLPVPCAKDKASGFYRRKTAVTPYGDDISPRIQELLLYDLPV